MQSRCRGQQPLLRVRGTASVSTQDIRSGPWSRAPATPALACFAGQFKNPVRSTRLHGVSTCLLPLRHLEPKLRSLRLALAYSHQRTPALLGVGFLDLQGEGLTCLFRLVPERAKITTGVEAATRDGPLQDVGTTEDVSVGFLLVVVFKGGIEFRSQKQRNGPEIGKPFSQNS